MLILGTTPQAKKQNKEQVSKILSTANFSFITILLLPFLIFAVFKFLYPNHKGLGTSNIKDIVVKIIIPQGCGSGFLISPTKILTARHVVEEVGEGGKVKIRFEAMKGGAGGNVKELVGTVRFMPKSNNIDALEYFATDFAIIEIPAVSDITPIELGFSDKIVEGEKVIVSGYPLCQDYTRTDNTINSLEYNQVRSLFKHNADTNPGNSGGPLIQASNNTVIGIVVGKPNDPRTQGGNVALKIGEVINICKTNGIDLTK